jgi:hypothetical protein
VSTVDSWMFLCETVAATTEPADRAALVEALAALGLADAQRAALAPAASGHGDLAQVVQRLVAEGSTPPVLVYADSPRWSDREVDLALGAATSIRAGDTAAGPADVVALPPDDAAALVSDLLTSGDIERLDWVLRSTAPHRFPVAQLLTHASALPAGHVRASLVRAIAAAPEVLVLRGATHVLAAARVTPQDVARVLSEVGRARRELADAGPYRWWQEQPQGQGAGAEPEIAVVGAAPTGDPGPVWRGSGDSDRREAYPRLDVATGTSRPDVVVIDQPFEVTLGIRPRRDRTLVATAPLTFLAGETVVLDLVLLHDPDSIGVAEAPRATVTVSEQDPWPSVTLTCTARYGEDLGPQRRLGLQVARAGQVVAVAWRTIAAVDTEQHVDLAPPVGTRDAELVDLAPLLGEDAPDLLVSVCRGDAESSWVWCAFAPDPTVDVPDLPSSTTLEGDVAGFALETRRSIAFSADASADFLSLAGRARRIGRAIPHGIQEAIRAVTNAPGRDRAPAVLLLTEELVVPWELACLEPRLVTPWGADSPFLGAHVAVGRWPLTEHRPRPRPRSAVSVRTGAVLTADYTGVPGWGRLDAAVAEAAEVARLFDPPAPTVAPDLWTVIDMLRGLPSPADVLHLALHGQYDAAGDQEGIVLLTKSSTTGSPVAQFLTPAEVENGSLEHGPLVFLNACQVGTDERVLGDYAGFASTLLRIGATAVVAPLWNIRDDVASSVAKEFYAAALGPEAVPVAEVVRALRATYTERAVRAGDPALHATLIAYQVFGHPRLRLRRAGATTSDTTAVPAAAPE